MASEPRHSRGHKRWASLSLGLLAMLLLAGVGWPQPVRAANMWFVNGSIGNDAFACTLATAPCKTLGGVLAKPLLANGDSIQIASGTYTEKNTLAKSLTISGAGQGVTVFDGSGLAAGSMFLVNAGVTATLQGYDHPQQHDGQQQHERQRRSHLQ